MSRVTTLTPSDRAQIVRRYVAGESTVKLAAEYGVYAGSIVYVLKLAEVTRRSQSEAARVRKSRQ